MGLNNILGYTPSAEELALKCISRETPHAMKYYYYMKECFKYDVEPVNKDRWKELKLIHLITKE